MCFIRSQTSVAGSSIIHTTIAQSAQTAIHEGYLRGSKAWRPHDGALRRDDAPRTSFFNCSDTLYSVSPHPVYGEAGELTTSIVIPLDKFIRTVGEYRLFFVSCAPREGTRYEQANYRTTLLFATAEHWQWCEDRGLLELDMHHNPILVARTDHDRRSAEHEYEWKVASHLFMEETGVRSTGVIVAVAGDKLCFDNGPSSSEHRRASTFDTSQVFRVSLS